ncbi:MAG: hypothetical protein H7832_10955 [Magnetococcus sp. DMHC-6]
MPTKEQRQIERFPLELKSQISFLGEEKQEVMMLLTKDVCSGGAFFKTKYTLPLGTKVEIELLLSSVTFKKRQSKENTLIKLSGLVHRIDENGMAILFEKEYNILQLIT